MEEQEVPRVEDSVEATNNNSTKSGERPYWEQYRHHHRERGVIFPLILILLGIYFLLREFNLLDETIARNIWKLWPLIFVYWGVDRLLDRSPRLKAVVLIGIVALAVFAVLLQSDGSFPRFR